MKDRNLVYIVHGHDDDQGAFVEFLANQGAAKDRVVELLGDGCAVYTWGDNGDTVAKAFVGRKKPEALAALNAVATGQIGKGIDWEPVPDPAFRRKVEKIEAGIDKKAKDEVDASLAANGVTKEPDGSIVIDSDTPPTFKPNEEGGSHE